MGANDGTLTFMVGGEKETYYKVKNLFEIMGKKNILCGSFGTGQSAKICNNMLLASTMIAVGESFKLAKNLNLDLEKLYDVLSTSMIFRNVLRRSCFTREKNTGSKRCEPDIRWKLP